MPNFGGPLHVCTRQPISLKRQGHLSSVLIFAGLGAYTVAAVSLVWLLSDYSVPEFRLGLQLPQQPKLQAERERGRVRESAIGGRRSTVKEAKWPFAASAELGE